MSMDPNSPEFQSMMKNFMQSASKIQESMSGMYQQMTQSQQDKTVEGSAGAGMVRAHVNMQLQLVKLDHEETLFQEKPEVVMELIVAAVNDAFHKAKDEVKNQMMSLGQKMGMPGTPPASNQ